MDADRLFAEQEKELNDRKCNLENQLTVVGASIDFIDEEIVLLCEKREKIRFYIRALIGLIQSEHEFSIVFRAIIDYWNNRQQTYHRGSGR